MFEGGEERKEGEKGEKKEGEGGQGANQLIFKISKFRFVNPLQLVVLESSLQKASFHYYYYMELSLI